MAERWIVNSSPLIHLARIGHLDLLVKAGAEIWIPNAVTAEILAGPIGDAAQALIASGWGIRVEPSFIPNTVLEWGLGPGETAVIAIGTESRDVTLILDDGRARTCARVHGLNVFGTLGLILRAKRQGRIPSAAAVLRALLAQGFYLDDKVISEALANTVGETWR